MAHADTSWRVGAIYRACVRWGMTADTAKAHMARLFKFDRNKGAPTVEIWFRNMAQRRAEYRGP